VCCAGRELSVYVDLMGSVGFQPFWMEEVGARLRKMSDDELIRFGQFGSCGKEMECEFSRYFHSRSAALSRPAKPQTPLLPSTVGRQ
jgi:hypothetical protein